MSNPILHGFRNLTRFSGRDTRGQFWPYVGVVMALVFVVNGVGMSWMMSDMFAEVQTYAAAHPESTTVTASPGGYSVRVEGTPPQDFPMPDFRIFGGVMGATVLAALALLAAAVSRRLHDRNMPAWWGLAPVPFLLFGVFGFTQLMGPVMSGGEPDFALFGLLFLNNVLYMVALVTLIILLAGRSAEGPNRFGPAG